MVKKIISSLTLSLMLFAPGAYASGDSGIPSLADTASSSSPGMSSLSSAAASSASSFRMPNLAASAGSLDEGDRKESRTTSSNQTVRSGASGSAVMESGLERGLDILYRELASSPLALGVHPNDLLKANSFLFGKYQPYLQDKFDSTILAPLDRHFMTFLTTNERLFPSLIDPDMMRVFLGFLTPLNAPFPMWYARAQFSIPEGGRVLLAAMARTQDGKLHVNLDGGLRLLGDTIAQSPSYMMQSPVPMMSGNGVPLGPVYAQLQKTVTVDGRQLYDVKSDKEALSQHLSGWFNFARGLYKREVDFWEKEAPLVEGLLADYNSAINKLRATDDKMYSGVGLGSNSILLIPTAKTEKKEERTALIEQVEGHLQAHQSKIDAYKVAKPILPTLQNGLKWLNEVFEYVKKNGRIT